MAKRAVVGGSPENMQREHGHLDQRVRELDRRAILTPSEQFELSELKKKKLMLKDYIRASQPPPVPTNA